MLRSLLLSFTLLLAAALRAADSAPALAGLTYSGDQAALEALDRDLNAAGTDPAKLAALETRLLTLLRRTDTTFAARQAAAQRLGSVLAVSAPKAKPDDTKPLGTMLADDRDTDLARLALEPAPGAVIDTLFVSALGKTTGRTRLGLIDSLARRRAAAAVPELIKLLKDSDASTTAAAARALGEIATAPAVAALHATPEPSSPAIATAKLAAAPRMPPAAALTLLRELEKSAHSPAHRTAAFRLSLEIEVGAAAARIAAALSGSDWTIKQAALEAIAASASPNLVATLTAKLATWDAPTQAAAITALARRPDPSALPAIVKAAAHPDAEVRRAALSALGFFPGSRDIAALLAQAIAGTTGEESRLARQSLARLHGPDVDTAIISGAERGTTALRVVHLEQLALRNQTEAIPLLLKCRQDPDAAIRSAAIGALGDIASPAEEAAILAWTIAATDDGEQTRALRTLVNVTLRHPVAARGKAVFAAIEQSPAPVALRLLPALARIGGQPAVDTARRLALGDDPKVSAAAADALARWPDPIALPALATIAQDAKVPATRSAALTGALRTFERAREIWTPTTTDVVRRLLASTKDSTNQKRLAELLNRANDQAALTLAESLQSDATLKSIATDAVEIIRVNLAGAPTVRASGTSNVKNMIDGKTSTYWSTSVFGDEWVEADFKKSRPVHRVTLDQTGRAQYFPERYAVFVTDDPEAPGEARATGAGQRNRTVIDLPAGTRGRYVIIRNTAERKDSGWSISELFVD